MLAWVGSAQLWLSSGLQLTSAGSRSVNNFQWISKSFVDFHCFCEWSYPLVDRGFHRCWAPEEMFNGCVLISCCWFSMEFKEFCWLALFCCTWADFSWLHVFSTIVYCLPLTLLTFCICWMIVGAYTCWYMLSSLLMRHRGVLIVVDFYKCLTTFWGPGVNGRCHLEQS